MVGLVYISGFAPDEGENLIDLQSKFAQPGIIPYMCGTSCLTVATSSRFRPQGFHETFRTDILAADAAFYAIKQCPLAGVALTEAAPTPALLSRPVWAVLPTADSCIDPGVHRFSFERMGATVTEIEGASHVFMGSHPEEVAEAVMAAVRACVT